MNIQLLYFHLELWLDHRPLGYTDSRARDIDVGTAFVIIVVSY